MMLALVTHVLHESKMATFLPVPTTGTCSCPLNLPHWLFFTISVLPTEKLLSMCYPQKNYMWFFSEQHTDNTKKLVSWNKSPCSNLARCAMIDFPTATG